MKWYINVAILFILLFNCDKQKDHLNFLISGDLIQSFRYSTGSELYLTRLKSAAGLDSVVLGAESQLDSVYKICTHVHSMWEHNGVNVPTKSDPISIIEEAKTGRRFRCIEYSTVIQSCLTAIDIPARIVVLMTRDVETVSKWGSHYIVEAFSRDHNKWFVVDGQWNAIPMLGEVPLNAVEFQDCLIDDVDKLGSYEMSDRTTQNYFRWIRPSLFYFQYFIDNRINADGKDPQKIMLVPLGAKKPTIFQRQWPMENMTYTHSLNSVYQNPVNGFGYGRGE